MASQAENSLQGHLFFLSAKGALKICPQKATASPSIKKNINNLHMLYIEVLQNNGQEAN